MASYSPSYDDISNLDNMTKENSYEPKYQDISNLEPSLSETNSKEEALKKVIGVDRTPLGNLRDALYSFGNVGAHLNKPLTNAANFLINKMGGPSNYFEHTAMPDIRQQNPNPFAEGVGGFFPFLMAGGPSLLGTTAAGGAYGATMYDPGQQGLIDSLLGIKTNRLSNSLEDAGINALTGGFSKVLFPAKVAEPIKDFSQKFTFGNPNDSEIGKPIFQPPNFLTQNQPEPISPSIAQDIHHDITEGRTLEQSGKELAKNLKDTHDTIRNAGEDRYNSIFNKSLDEPNIQGEDRLVGEQNINNSEYLKNFRNIDIPDKNIDELHKEFIDSPTINTGHEIQSELGKEIGYMSNQLKEGKLDSLGKDTLRKYINMRSVMQSDIHSGLHSIDPKLSQDYSDSTQFWNNRLIPFYRKMPLRKIVQGEITNPSSAQVNSIFKNPEEDMQQIISSLPERTTNRIVHIGMGKNQFQNTPKDILSGITSLDKKGLGTYLSPNQHQNYLALRNSLERESEQATQANQNKAVLENLKNAFHEAENARIAQAKNIFSRRNLPEKEAKQISDARMRDVQEKYKNSIKEMQENTETRNNIIRGLIGGGVGIGFTHGLGINPEDVLGGYLGKAILGKRKKY